MKSFEQLMAQEKDSLTQCVHCGLCLDDCPTYVMSGDENNSPRGRLFQWKALAQGELAPSKTMDHYSDQCLGCMACESVCPANVPYTDLLTAARKEQNSRAPRHWKLRLMAPLLKRPALFNFLTLPARLARQASLRPHRLLPPGEPEALNDTQGYAEKIQLQWRPEGPLVDLHTGCLMEGVFRDINFASVRVLAANGYRVRVPKEQNCCGSFHEHEGFEGKAELDTKNRAAFEKSEIVVSNSSGCGLSLSKGLKRQVLDPGSLLNGLKTLRRGKNDPGVQVFYDQPCHLLHGQQISPPKRVFEALTPQWELAPQSDRCCGAGGAYNLTHPQNADTILKEKAAFLFEAAENGPVTLVVANHVCLAQWESGKASGAVPTDVRILHLVQALDEAYQRAGLY